MKLEKLLPVAHVVCGYYSLGLFVLNCEKWTGESATRPEAWNAEIGGGVGLLGIKPPPHQLGPGSGGAL